MLSKAAGAGAVRGCLVWMIYAVVEEAFSSVRPMVGGANPLVLSWHWVPLAQSYVAFAVAGLLMGAVCGLLVRQTSQLTPATLTVVVAFSANLAFLFPLTGAESAAFAAGLLLAAALIARIAGSRSRWLPYLCEPWSVFILLLGVHWIAREVAPRNSIAVTALHVAALLFAAAMAGLVSHRRLTSLGHALAVLAAIPAMAACMLGLNRELPSIRPSSDSPAAVGPSVVLITLDTVWARHLSLYGYERRTTPELEKLAARATLYTHATAASNSTLPTHSSIFTGAYARRHGAHFFPPDLPDGRPLPPESRTLAEILAGAGYTTLAVVANVGYLNPAYGVDQGFQLFDSSDPVKVTWANQRHYVRDRLRSLIGLFTSTLEFDRITRTAGEMNADVLALLNDLANDRRPFFLFVNYMDAHGPYLPPPPFDSMFPGKDPAYTLERYRRMTHEMGETGRSMTSAERGHYTSQYDGGIAYMDFHLGRLIERLWALDLYENTLLIITSDHGEAFGENGIVGHSRSSYEHQLFVPLVVKYPAQTQPRTVDGRVSQVDLMPTVLEVAGLEAPPEIDGRSLVHEIPMRPILSEDYSAKDPGPPARAIFQGEMKMIAPPSGERELYNLAGDPGELRNLYRDGDPRAAAMMESLDDWVRRVPPPAHTPSKTDDRTLDRLRGLGYVQ